MVATGCFGGRKAVPRSLQEFERENSCGAVKSAALYNKRARIDPGIRCQRLNNALKSQDRKVVNVLVELWVDQEYCLPFALDSLQIHLMNDSYFCAHCCGRELA